MSEETSKEFFESVLGLGPDWHVSGVTVDEASREVVLDVNARLGCGPFSVCLRCDSVR